MENNHTTTYHPMAVRKIQLETDEHANYTKCNKKNAYNATRNEATGLSPFYLVFGRHSRLPIDLAMGVESNKRQVEVEGHVDYTK